MVYVFRPAFISLSLNSDLNTDYDTAIEIVSNAARFISSLIDTRNYDKFVRENTLIE